MAGTISLGTFCSLLVIENVTKIFTPLSGRCGLMTIHFHRVVKLKGSTARVKPCKRYGFQPYPIPVGIVLTRKLITCYFYYSIKPIPLQQFSSIQLQDYILLCHVCLMTVHFQQGLIFAIIGFSLLKISICSFVSLSG